MRYLAALVCCLTLASCAESAAPAGADRGIHPNTSEYETSAGPQAARSRTVRLSGVLEAVRSTRVSVPQITGPVPRVTLTRIVENGATVAQGDIVAEFDPLEQITAARDSAASYEDLSFQVRQREADNAASAERRRLEREQAEADLAKAELEVTKAPFLSKIEVQKNEIRMAMVRTRLESLARTQADEELAEQAQLRILELQRDRQRAAYERAQANLDRLQVRAPISGTVALSTIISSSTLVRPQVGDQMTRNAALLSIFDPGEMLVRVQAAEPDGALLQPGLQGTVYVDAYPDLALTARLVAASPVAASPGLGRGIKAFMAVFRLEETDPRLMPDLSAAVVFTAGEGQTLADADLTPAGGIE